MPENWKTYKLGEVADLRKKTVRPKDFNGEKYIGLEHIGQGDFLLNGIGISSDVTSNKFKFKGGDILYGKIRPYFKKVYKPKFSGICSTDVLIIKSSSEEVVIQEYLYQLIKTQTFTDKAVETSSGTKMPRADWNSLKQVEFSFPPIQEQKSIASILSAIDDKIELNLQMNKTLEEMAMVLYKHWFVDFGPFQDGEFVASELGEIPKGWEVLSLSDITSKITDGAHHSPKSVEQGKPMASVKDMDHWGFNVETCRKISEEDYIKLTNQGCRPLKNDVVIAKDGSYLKHAFVIEKDLDIVLLSSIAILKPNGRLNPHLLNLNLKLDSVKTRMKAIVSGAAIQRIVLKEFRKFLIIVPPRHIQNSALQSIEGLMEKCWNNNSENQTLTQLRETLLPKLISGEVRVKDAEKTLSEVL